MSSKSSAIKFLKFNNPTQGQLLFAEALSEITSFMGQDPKARYNMMIGSDSNGSNVLDVVSVLAIHRIGNGGRYFWCRTGRDGIHTLRQKIYAEVEASLELASLFLPAFRKALSLAENKTELPFDFQIHVDVGRAGETRDLVQEITGMVRGYGYNVFVKPESAAATTVADRHVR